METSVIILLCLEAALALWLLVRSGLTDTRCRWFISVALTMLAFALRWVCLPYETLDYTNFLSRWVDFYRTNGGFSAFASHE